MKRLSLLNLSGQALGKLQEKAVTGGGVSPCICAHICAGCPCRGNDVEAVIMYNGVSDNDVEDTAEAAFDPEY